MRDRHTETDLPAEPPAQRRARFWLLWATVFVLLCGALEGWYGKTDSGDVYGSDAVQYLDCARAIGRHDWRTALNPLWSQGYPALLALARPLLAQGPEGDWMVTRLVNFGVFVFSWAGFLFLLWEVGRHRRWTPGGLLGAVGVFLTAQVCLDQVSRVGPDQWVAGLFFLGCALLLRLWREPGYRVSAGLGLVLGLGFVVKAAYLALGCVVLATAAIALRRRVRLLLPAAAVFAACVLAYGAALSHAVGHATLGEAGSLNYAWHVDRLAKWVHWEGGVDPADKAWPKPWIASFVHWDKAPPDFGVPLHPDERLGSAPTIYIFHESDLATYTPYYDPSYWYSGYRPVYSWRYQVVALGKNMGDLVRVLLGQPMIIGFGLVGLILGITRTRRQWMVEEGRRMWPVLACAVAGVLLYLPVHLEGRYLSGSFAVLALWPLLVLDRVRGPIRPVLVTILVVGFGAGLGGSQHVVWGRAAHHWSPRDNPEWKAGSAVAATGIAPGSEVGMISWTPNLHCDWAYMAGLRITSEIESGADEAAFWALPEAERRRVLTRFRDAGAVAVLTWDRPRGGAAGWRQVGPMWMYRF